MPPRYFEGSHPELAARLEEHFDRVRARWAEISGKASSLVLGGGYGRGEGGVTNGPKGPGFFNDLDYFLFSDTPDDPDLVSWCASIEKDETELLGADVEIKRLPEEDVNQGLGTMMFADLVGGHVTVAGEASFLEVLNGRVDFGSIGAEDAARLLWNRASGLYFARSKMTTDPVFVVRNHAKLKLALGDALLCLEGDYVPRCRERGASFASTDADKELKEWHAEAVEFKFRPVTPVLEAAEIRSESKRLADAWLKVFLKVEASRLSMPRLTLAGYLDLPRVFPDTPMWRNVALAARDRMKREACLRPWSDYPRGALMRALPCLLGLGGNAGRFLPGKVPWEDTYFRWWQFYC